LATRVSPIGKNAKYARIDQGVDWSQSEPYKAVGSGTVVKISHGFVGMEPGDDWGVYIVLDHPITVNGRTYGEVYYAETKPLVRVNQRVKAGQPVTVGGAAEIGFARNGTPVSQPIGGIGSGTKPSQAGQDFYDFVTHAHTVTNTPQPTPMAPGDQVQPNGQQQPTIVPPVQQALPNEMSIGAPGASLPGSVSYTTHPVEAAQLWQQVADSTDVLSPDTQQLLNNAQMAAGGTGAAQ